MSTPEVQAELEQIRAALTTLAAEQPTAVLLAMLDQLVEVTCGTNPALKDFMRLQFYRGVLSRLRGSVSRLPWPR